LGLFGSAQEIFMSLHSIRAYLLVLASGLFLAACGGNSTSSTPPPPVGGLSVAAGDSQVTVSWKETPGVEYWIFAAPNNPTLSLSNWLSTTGSTYRLKVTSPYVVSGLTNGTPYSFFMTGRYNSGPGGEATPTAAATPRLAGAEWSASSTLNTGTPTGLTFGSYIDTATNSVQYTYLAVGNGGKMFRAADLNTWTAITPVVSANLHAADYGFSKFIAVGAGGSSIYSSDAKTWTQSSKITTQNLNAIANNGGLAIAVGDNGTVVTSKDGITWTLATTVPTSNNLYGVSYTSAGTWAAVGAGGTILTSGDGLNWTAQNSGTQADLKALGSIATVTAGLTSHQFIAVGANGSILSSPDAITWSAQSANTKANFNALSTANQFLAVGSGGTIVTSLDGINWKSQASPSTANLTYLLRAQNTYIAVNSSGGIIYSK
jgi:hypothetical protein